jgi:Serine dehydrogenase proteinase
MTDTKQARYLLIWYTDSVPINYENLQPIRRIIEDAVKEPREEVAVDVWLESGGGDANAAFKLALMLRAIANLIRVVIPDYAKSAATLLALAGHEIYMAPGAELGPLDMQLYDEGTLLEYTSALNVARAADDVGRDAVDLAMRGGAEIIRMAHLSRVDAMTTMLKFAAEFYAPLVCQLDPRVVYDAKQALKSANNYAQELLVETCGPQASKIAARLVETFPTHGFVISYGNAQRLGLPIRPIAEYDLLDHARRFHRESEDGPSMIRFSSLDEFLSEVGGEDIDHTQANSRT